MKKAIWISLGIILAIAIGIIIFTCTQDYRVANEDTYSLGTVDIYQASKEELIALDLCDYPEVFGEIKTEKEAAQIAAKVIE